MAETTPENIKKPVRHNGFTCPKCGSHMFGTTKNFRGFFKNFPEGVRVGQCNEHQYSLNNCEFVWNRDDPEQESQVMYQQTREEWMSQFDDSEETKA